MKQEEPPKMQIAKVSKTATVTEKDGEKRITLGDTPYPTTIISKAPETYQFNNPIDASKTIGEIAEWNLKQVNIIKLREPGVYPIKQKILIKYED